MKNTIFDKKGNARLIIKERGRLVDFSGNNIGFIHENSLYDYNGRHRGWFEMGVMRDHDGYCVGFVRGATGSPRPILPVPKISPIPGIPKIAPIRPIRVIKPIKPIKKFDWSSFDPISLFYL